jgi:dTMP kinase
MLLLTIAVGPVVAGVLGSHSIKVGETSRLRFSGPGLTLLLGGIMALGVSYYATSRATRSRTRLRDIVRRRVINTGMGRRRDHSGLFVSVDGVDAAATAAYTALLVAAVRARRLVVSATSEPTDSAVGRQVAEALRGSAADGIEPETAALLSAADRAEHVAATIRPALERGEVVICDRYVLTSLALHGGGRGADVERIRSLNSWSTGELLPDLTIVVEGGGPSDPTDDDTDHDAVAHTLLEAADADPDRCVVCPADAPDALPAPVLDRLRRLVETRASLLAATADRPPPTVAETDAR